MTGNRIALAADPHGREADQPTDMPPVAWKDVLLRVRREAGEDNATLLAAGVAFYGLLALVPGLIALISLYGLVADPATVESQVTDALAAAPAEVRDMMGEQMTSIASGRVGTAVVTFVVGLALALWSASGAMGNLVTALNVTYDEDETRGFVKRKLLALGLTLGAVLFMAVAFVILAVAPALVDGLGAVGRWTVLIVRWVVLVGGMLVGLAVLYRYAPDRDEPRWRWVTPGSLLAAVLFVIGSLLFSLYTSTLGSYNETYGSLAGVVVVMLWLWLTALAVLLGSELNAELERQTLRDTTVGADQPLGARGAEAADTVGATADEMHDRA